MQVGYEISRALKELKTNTSNDREIRAMMVANALGYQFPIDPTLSCAEIVEANTSLVKKVIGQINENIPLDSKLALELYKQVIAIRLELIRGVTDPSLLEAALRSRTADLHQTSAESRIVTTLVTNLEFTQVQNTIRQALSRLPLE